VSFHRSVSAPIEAAPPKDASLPADDGAIEVPISAVRRSWSLPSPGTGSPRGSDDDSGDSVDRVTSAELAGTADLAGPHWHVNGSGSANGDGGLHHANATGTNGNGLSRFGMGNQGMGRRGGSLENLQVGMET